MTTLKVWNGSEWEYLTGGAAILQQDAEPEDPVEDDLWVDTDAVATDYATDAELTTHAADTTSVHGITDTSALALTSAVVTKALLDAKGDLIVATAADTPARLAVGVTNGHVLTVDSAETTGLKWAEAAGGGGADIPYQTDAPSSPATGDLWVDSDEAHSGLFIVRFAVGNGAGDYSTASTTFVDVDATNLALSIPAAVGDRLEMYFSAMVNHSVSANTSYFRIGFAVAGTDVGPTEGAAEIGCINNGTLYPLSGVWWHTVVSGDISGGNVAVKARYTGVTGTKTLKNAATNKR